MSMISRVEARRLLQEALEEFAPRWEISADPIEMTIRDPYHWLSGIGTFGVTLRDRATGAFYHPHKTLHRAHAKAHQPRVRRTDKFAGNPASTVGWARPMFAGSLYDNLLDFMGLHSVRRATRLSLSSGCESNQPCAARTRGARRAT